MKQVSVFAGVAALAWICQATLALTDAGGRSDRIALVPLWLAAFGFAFLAGLLALISVRRGVARVPYLLLTLCLLPWLPVSVPPAFLLWTGRMAWLPWVGVAVIVVAALRPERTLRVRRPQVLAGALATIVFGAAAASVTPRLPGGDEPHYLVITQSLINDGDLRIENNHQRGDYHAYFPGELRPDYLKRGSDGEIYSIHAPGLSALVAPAFAVAGYRGVVVFLVILSALGSALAWHVAWLRTGRADAAWFGWAAVTLSVSTVFHSFSVYPDGPGAVIVLTGVWALLRAEASSARGADAPDDKVRPWLLHGAALALLPWLHSRFALLAGTLGLLILARLWSTRNPVGKSLAFLLVPAISCAGWIAYFQTIYGVMDPTAPYGGDIGSVSYIADGLAGLFFDQRFGLLPYAPVLVFALAGFGVMRNRLAIELLLVVVPYLLLVTNFRMWWGGWSAPARFAVPVLLLLSIPAAAAWVAIRRRGTRVTALGTLILTALTTTIVGLVDGGALAYNVRTEPSLWIGWLTQNADLANAVPLWSDRKAVLFGDIGIWCAALLLAWVSVRGLDWMPGMRSRTGLATAAAGIFATAGMAAATIAWQVKGTEGTAPLPAQMGLLRRAATEPRAAFIGLRPPRRLERGTVAGEMRLRPRLLPPAEGAPVEHALLFAVPAVPAGEYRLQPRSRGTGGALAIGVGRDEFSIASAPPTSEPIVVRLPVDVRALLVRGDGDAQRNLRGLVIETVSLVGPAARLTDAFATAAVRYGQTTVFFLDDRSFPEADAFWIGGAQESSVVLQPSTSSPTAMVLVRNAPVENHLLIRSGDWHTELNLAPGEERRMTWPLDVERGSSLVRFSVASGFRPSELDVQNRDHRYLGVWIKVLQP